MKVEQSPCCPYMAMNIDSSSSTYFISVSTTDYLNASDSMDKAMLENSNVTINLSTQTDSKGIAHAL